MAADTFDDRDVFDWPQKRPRRHAELFVFLRDFLWPSNATTDAEHQPICEHLRYLRTSSGKLTALGAIPVAA
jgi:hypothetical protein